MNIKLSVQRNPMMQSIEFWLVEKDNGGKLSVGTNVLLKTLDEGAYFSEPTFRLTDEAMQLFIDELWNQGFRPSKFENDGSAQEKHLQDMRKIAFQFLDKLINEKAKEE